MSFSTPTHACESPYKRQSPHNESLKVGLPVEKGKLSPDRQHLAGFDKTTRRKIKHESAKMVRTHTFSLSLSLRHSKVYTIFFFSFLFSIPIPKGTHIAHIGRHAAILRQAARLVRHVVERPIVGTVPPAAQAGTGAGAAELGGAVPGTPAVQGEAPEGALEEGEYDLVFFSFI